MLKNPSEKYDGFKAPLFRERQWPNRVLTKAPRWLATDLRDGNQSLARPMTVEQKWIYFNMLLEIGFKEIDVSFPSASQTEFDFTRRLVETPGAVPEDVWIQVLSPCKREHIQRTVDSVSGARKAILSLYIASSDTFLDTVFDLKQDQVLEMAVDCVRYARSISKDDPKRSQTKWNLMFSPEAFSDTSVEFSSKLCQAARDAWGSTEQEPIILNLPATVEMSTPNTYADQVELFCRSLTNRQNVCVSLHPHNDRGCAVAAAELGQLAGADRVEGCLFGNGERTGNVDLVTLALNLYSHGISPNLDFSNLPTIREIFKRMTHMAIPDRMPYSGDYVFRAYSGSHQDAINKGFKKHQKPNRVQVKWKVPYLSIDPMDIGSNYEAVILVNSQSGKGGIEWSLERLLGIEIPKSLALEFSKTVKSTSETLNRTISAEEIRDLFFKTYHVHQPHPRILSARHLILRPTTGTMMYKVEASVMIGKIANDFSGVGETIPSAVSDAVQSIAGRHLSFKIRKLRLSEALGQANVLVIGEVITNDGSYGPWGACTRSSVERAELLACLSAAMAYFEHHAEETRLDLGNSTFPSKTRLDTLVPRSLLQASELGMSYTL